MARCRLDDTMVALGSNSTLGLVQGLVWGLVLCLAMVALGSNRN